MAGHWTRHTIVSWIAKISQIDAPFHEFEAAKSAALKATAKQAKLQVLERVKAGNLAGFL